MPDARLFSFLLIVAFFGFPLVLVSACGSADDDDSADHDDAGDDDADDDSGDDDTSEDDTADDDTGDDDDFGDDDTATNIADGELAADPRSISNCFAIDNGCVTQISRGSPGRSGIDTAVDPDGTVYVAAADGREVTLYTRSADTSDWTARTLALLGVDPRIEIDSENGLHFIYGDVYRQALVYAYDDGDFWDDEIIEETGPIVRFEPDRLTNQQAELALDAQDRPHVVYLNHGERVLKYATKVAGEWAPEPIQAPLNDDLFVVTGAEPSVRIDNDGRVQALYQPAVIAAEPFWSVRLPNVNYLIREADSAWTQKLVTLDGYAPTLLLDVDDHPHVFAPQRVGGSSIDHYLLESDQWKLDPQFAQGWKALQMSAAIDPGNRFHLAFADAENGATIYAKQNEAAEWTYESINPDYFDSLITAVDINAAGDLAIITHQESPGSLHAQTRAPGGPWREIVLGEGTASPLAVLQYRDGRALVIGEQQHDGKGLRTFVLDDDRIDSGRIPGTHSVDSTDFRSFALDAQDRLHFFAMDRELYYFHQTDGGFEKEKISGFREAVTVPYLTLDAMDHAHAMLTTSSPTKEDFHAIYYITNSSGAWTSELVADLAYVRYAQLAFDEKGSLYGVWNYSGSFGFFGRRSENGWEKEIIPAPDPYLLRSPLAFNMSGPSPQFLTLIHDWYHETDTLNLVTRGESDWTFQQLDVPWGYQEADIRATAVPGGGFLMTFLDRDDALVMYRVAPDGSLISCRVDAKRGNDQGRPLVIDDEVLVAFRSEEAIQLYRAPFGAMCASPRP